MVFWLAIKLTTRGLTGSVTSTTLTPFVKPTNAYSRLSLRSKCPQISLPRELALPSVASGRCASKSKLLQLNSPDFPATQGTSPCACAIASNCVCLALRYCCCSRFRPLVSVMTLKPFSARPLLNSGGTPTKIVLPGCADGL